MAYNLPHNINSPTEEIIEIKIKKKKLYYNVYPDQYENFTDFLKEITQIYDAFTALNITDVKMEVKDGLYSTSSDYIHIYHIKDMNHDEN